MKKNSKFEIRNSKCLARFARELLGVYEVRSSEFEFRISNFEFSLC
jgi:hypothetical protein